MRVQPLVVFVCAALITSSAGANKTRGDGASASDVWVSPATTRVPHDASKPTNASGEWDFSAAYIDAARGERENVFVNVRIPVASSVSVSVSSFSNVGVQRISRQTVDRGEETIVDEDVQKSQAHPSVALGRVVAVPCAESAFYSLPGGFYPDAVMTTGGVTLEFNGTGNMTHSILVEAVVPSGTPPGNYSAQLTVTTIDDGAVDGAAVKGRDVHAETGGSEQNRFAQQQQHFIKTIPINLHVWPVDVPSVLDAAMPTIFNFPFVGNADGATDVGAYYGHPGTVSNATASSWFNSLCTCRVPPDLPYTTTLRSLQDLERVADPQICNGGAPRMALLNVVHAANSSSLQPQKAYSDSQLNAVVELLKPLVEEVRARGWIERAYVYGFDEVSPDYTLGIEQLFGAVKAAFPDLRTVATLRWAPPSNASFPLDTWNNLYSLWDDDAAAAWKAARKKAVHDHKVVVRQSTELRRPRVVVDGSSSSSTDEHRSDAPAASLLLLARETWAYHCISPRPPEDEPVYHAGTGWLNTFVEYPLVSGRLLMWWASGRRTKVDGWLYYLVNGWSSTNDYQPLTSNASSQAAFSAVRPNGKLHGFSNGDGILVYPGPQEQPTPSLRLLSFRDGLEDYELFHQVAQLPHGGGQEALAAALQPVLRSATNYTIDVPGGEVSAALAMRKIRRWAFEQLSQTGRD